jgi:hypothetical protein
VLSFIEKHFQDLPKVIFDQGKTIFNPLYERQMYRIWDMYRIRSKFHDRSTICDCFLLVVDDHKKLVSRSLNGSLAQSFSMIIHNYQTTT